MLHLDVITLFPEYFAGPLRQSIIGKAIEQKKVQVAVHHLDLLDWENINSQMIAYGVVLNGVC